MLDDELNEGSTNNQTSDAEAPVVKKTVRRRTTKKAAAVQAPPAEVPATSSGDDSSGTPLAGDAPVVAKTTRRRATKKAAAKPVADSAPAEAATSSSEDDAPKSAPVKRTRARKTTKKAASTDVAAPESGETSLPTAEVAPAPPETEPTPGGAGADASEAKPAKSGKKKSDKAKREKDQGDQPKSEKANSDKAKSDKAKGKGGKKKKVTDDEAAPAEVGVGADAADGVVADQMSAPTKTRRSRRVKASADDEASVAPLFQVPSAIDGATEQKPDADNSEAAQGQETGPSEDNAEPAEGESGPATARRRRRRGGRRRRKGGEAGAETEATSDTVEAEAGESDATVDQAEGTETTSSRRRRRRRRAGEDGEGAGDDPAKTVTKVRRGRTAEDEITAVTGSTRLEAKKQRRREGREAGRRRAPIVSEAEFLARRESVDRVMAIRQREDVTQIAVLEDKVLVEHYVARESQTSLIGNVYLGRVQNVLPSMEAAFIDIGKGRNAVLYAGEVNWQALGHKEGEPRKIESVLSSGQAVLVQVTKDPVGHKGARLTSQVSLAGRFLVYVPDGTTSGISRKLPDTERARLKALLKEVVPETAGVIVRTAAEGAAEDELRRDVERLQTRWADIEKKIAKGNSPQLLYGEPDLMLKVVRDLFTEDFSKLIVDGEDAWRTVKDYVTKVAPDLEERCEKHDPNAANTGGRDLFAHLRIEEQIHKGLDRKVWLPSGGSLIIDRTEAMTVVDVNTGKFTGSGGNLEETVTKNNLEAAEEIVRQLRLRDIGGIIVVDFIDMVLESNRDLVLRRLVECLGRDRTRHQVAEVTSLGLVQMTRKRIGTGLLEAFSENCEHCQGRGVVVHDAPIEPRRGEDNSRSRRTRRGRGGDNPDFGTDSGRNSRRSTPSAPPSPRDVALMARPSDESASADSTEIANAETQPAESATSGVEASVPEAADPQSVGSEPTAGPTPEEPSDETGAPEVPQPAGQELEAVSEVSATVVSQTTDEAVEPAAPSAPTKVTRGRRRAASRPAGPPATSSEPGVIYSEGLTTPTDSAPADPPPIEHVPVKKRTRKR